MADLKTEKKVELQRPKQYIVQFINDDFTSFDLVIAILQQVFKKTVEEATSITNEIHKSGKGVAGGPYTLEVAETKLLHTEHIAMKYESPLKASVEEA